MDYRKATPYLIIFIIVILIGYDIVVLYKDGTEATVSYTLFVWSHKYPLTSFVFGFFCGHIYWRLRDNEVTKKISDIFKGT